MSPSRTSAGNSASPTVSVVNTLGRAETRAPATDTLLFSQRRERRVLRRRVSPFNIMLGLLVFAVAIVLYIGNIIAVEQLMRDIGQLEARHRRILADQEILRAQVNRMSSLDRIQKMAEDQLQLKLPTVAPQWITVDSNRIEEVEQAAVDNQHRF